MRCDASDPYVGGCWSAASAAPVGGAEPVPPALETTTATSASATPAALPKRRTGVGIEQVDLRDVDRHLDVVRKMKLRGLSGRQRRDEVRAGRGHALRMRLLFLLGLLGELARAHDDRVDLEVRHRVRPERLDELEARRERREVRSIRGEVDVVAAHAEDDIATGVTAHAGIARERLV